jgi:hypothetical protein
VGLQSLAAVETVKCFAFFSIDKAVLDKSKFAAIYANNWNASYISVAPNTEIWVEVLTSVASTVLDSDGICSDSVRCLSYVNDTHAYYISFLNC